ncbi:MULTISPECIES: lipase family protein [unclassified Rhodococcus (in: high G+C Gram-positive bacteria)]|uniref:lipase family protein n=1 Tax=unclassified Rhodococcus (in: high G+C Gram-positive bacteria) TaxID=192944 RepID=UPI0007BB3781|nr:MULTISPECIES: lipase family protein [unclassified Rhodococcus (in: high G+C Gram-positive bacteria)]KZE98243.1 triacylglycerol lipase [Rhodococcus sp. EPR-147]KZF06971.1 triacylglycerol lipase [Rhodococcus sp. EPR-279]
MIDSGGRWARRAQVVLLVAASALVGGGVAEANPQFPPAFPSDQNQLPQLPSEPQLYEVLPVPVPDEDPWYDDPSDIENLEPGAVVRTREVQTRILGIPFPVYTRQILYRTSDVHDTPTVTATTVVVPGIPWTGSPRPVVSFQEAIDSTDSSCNPSFTLQVGTMKESALLAGWLAQGFAINIPDFDGKNNTFNTYDEGKMVLDSLRAMKNEMSLGLSESAIALYGYSGGGSGSLRAAELRQSYAPDIALSGTAIGGTPGDLVTLSNYATEPQTGIAGTGNFTMWLGFAALSRQYPEVFDSSELLTVEGQQLVADLESRCVYSAALTGVYRPISEYFQPGKTLATAPGVLKVLQDNSLGQHIPDSPILWWHGVWDELIPQSSVLPTVEEYWASGADLRFYTSPIPEHLVNSTVGFPPAVAWISAVLRGLPPGPTFKADFAPLPEGFPGS